MPGPFHESLRLWRAAEQTTRKAEREFWQRVKSGDATPEDAFRIDALRMEAHSAFERMMLASDDLATKLNHRRPGPSAAAPTVSPPPGAPTRRAAW